MKMRSEDYAQLEQAINRVMAEQPDKTAQGYAAVGLSAKRFRLDALYAAVSWGYFPRLSCDDGSRCNDTHIDTALRRITGTK